MSKSNHKPICRYVSAGITCSVEYRALSCDGPSRLLFLFLLIHPHGGSFHVPGLYKVGPDTLRETSALPRKAFQKAFAELHDRGLLRSDKDSQLVWLPSALHLMGPPANPNMVRGYCRSMQHMPECSLLDDALRAYGLFLTEIGDNFFEPFAEAFGDHLERVFPGWSNTPLNDFERVDETYSHNNIDKYTDTHIKDASKGFAKHSGNEIHRYFDEIARQNDWPRLTTARADKLREDTPYLSLDEIKRARLATTDRKDIRDPWGYLFAIIRRNRDDARPSWNEAMPHEPEANAFQKFVDGEEVSFNG